MLEVASHYNIEICGLIQATDYYVIQGLVVCYNFYIILHYVNGFFDVVEFVKLYYLIP